MKFISHRGNLEGPDLNTENAPAQIDKCISLGFDIEVDLRFIDNKIFLGHDFPQYEVDFIWLLYRHSNLWIHCKNLQALELFYPYKEFNYFWHEQDSFTLTSKKYIWTYMRNPLGEKSIAVLPELEYDLSQIKNLNCFGVCSDFVGLLK